MRLLEGVTVEGDEKEVKEGRGREEEGKGADLRRERGLEKGWRRGGREG